MALRNTMAVVLPLAAGAAVGQPLAGLTVAVGGLNVAFSDGTDAYRTRAARMLAATFFSGVSVFASATTAGVAPIHVLLTAVWAFTGGMLVVLGTTPAQIGLTTLILFIVFGAEPLAPDRALAAAALTMGGGLLQTILAIAAWPARGLAPERLALERSLRAVAEWAGSPHEGDAALPATVETSAASEALTAARAEHGPVAEALVGLLNQVERARLDLVALEETQRRLGAREQSSPEAASRIGDLIGATADVMLAMADSLADTAPATSATGAIARVDAAANALREAERGAVGDARWLLSDARARADALGGELRAAVEMTVRARPGAPLESFRVEPALPPALRPEHVWRRVRANLTLRSSAFRHAVRLAACVSAADVLARVAHVPHGYWIPMTAAIVLKPDFTATFARGIARLAGTLVGLVVASYALHLVPATAVGLITLVAAFTFAAFLPGRANYVFMVAPVTALIVVLLAMGGAPTLSAIEARGVATLVGGTGALAVYAAWPTWERTQVPLVLADLLDAYRVHFEQVVQASLGTITPSPDRLDATRLAARLARSTAEASVDRMETEPGSTAADHGAAVRFLAASRRFARAMMAMEADLHAARPLQPWPPEVGAFAFDVNIALGALAGALRGQPAALLSVPDTRADQLALRAVAAATADPADPRVALTLDQTDRMANAINTMIALVRERVGEAARPRPDAPPAPPDPPVTARATVA